jgi:hypothetical protein
MYNYEIEKPKIFSEQGQVMFLKIRDNAFRLCRLAGCATMEKITAGNVGDSWEMLACVDRLKEIGELVEIERVVSVAGQYRIFILPNYGY